MRLLLTVITCLFFFCPLIGEEEYEMIYSSDLVIKEGMYHLVYSGELDCRYYTVFKKKQGSRIDYTSYMPNFFQINETVSIPLIGIPLKEKKFYIKVIKGTKVDPFASIEKRPFPLILYDIPSPPFEKMTKNTVQQFTVDFIVTAKGQVKELKHRGDFNGKYIDQVLRAIKFNKYLPKLENRKFVDCESSMKFKFDCSKLYNSEFERFQQGTWREF